MFLICLIASLSPYSNTNAETNWAKITTVGEYLYLTPKNDTSYENVVCMLESTYFVNILFETDNYYRVNYNNATGYVKKNAVKRVSGEPQNPYPNNIKLTIYSKNCYLRATPTQNSLGNDIVLLPANTSGIQFIGRINGTRIEDFGDNTWYYVAYSGKLGYIFSGYISNSFTIYPNTEELAEASNSDSVLNPLSNTSVAIIVVLLLLPMIVILYLMYHKPNKKVKHKVKTKILEDEML